MKLLYQKIKQKLTCSISFKFFAVFLLCLIIPLIILIQLFSYGFHSVLIDKERNYTSEKVKFATHQMSNILEEMDNIATALMIDSRITAILSHPSIAPSFEWFEGYKSLNSTLSLLAYNANNQYSITVIGSNQSLYQTGAPYNNNLNLSAPICQYIETQGGRLTIFNRKLQGFDENDMLCIGRAVYIHQQLLGIILIEVPSSSIDNILSPLYRTDTRLCILNHRNELLYDTSTINNTVLPEELVGALETNATEIKLDGESFLLMQQNVPKLPISVVALVTTKSVFHDSTLLLTLFIFCFFFIIAATTIGIFLLMRFFTKDITSLSHAVANFGCKPDTLISLPLRTKDEVGQLTEGVMSMSQRIQGLLLHIAETEKNKRLLEFQALQSQINPHMIYNTLNTITYLAELQNVANIQEVSSSFAFLLRSLSNIQGEYLTIGQEIEYLKAYIAIKKYNLLHDIQITFEVDEHILDYQILKLLLQPIVENAMIHGLEHNIEDGFIHVKIALNTTSSLMESQIEICIFDNGSGITEESLEQILSGKSSSHNTFLRVGIHNIMERLSIHYENQGSFTIKSTSGNGTSVYLSFPAHTGKEDTV